jgi:hypothetical protein
MSSKLPFLPHAIAAAWAREIAHDAEFNRVSIKRMRLFARAAEPIAAELAAALAPSERLPNGVVRLHVPIGSTFKDDTIKPGQLTWTVDFDPKTGNWDAPGAAPWSPGIAGLAAHVRRVSDRGCCRSGGLEILDCLAASLGFALLSVLSADDPVKPARAALCPFADAAITVQAYIYRARNGRDMAGVWCPHCQLVHSFSCGDDVAKPRPAPCLEGRAPWFGKTLLLDVRGRAKWIEIPKLTGVEIRRRAADAPGDVGAA